MRAETIVTMPPPSLTAWGTQGVGDIKLAPRERGIALLEAQANEDKVVYEDAEDGRPRSVRGRVDEPASDPDFLMIRRAGGDLRIARRRILEIRSAPAGRGAKA